MLALLETVVTAADRTRVAAVLRRAAEPRGLHAAIRDAGADDIADAVWAAFYRVGGDACALNLLEAARRVEKGLYP